MSLHLRNARIWTGDARRPWASSLTIRQGRIASLDEDVPADQVIDAEGRTAVPGLIDAHVHLLVGGESLGDLDLSGVRSREAFEAAVARRHRELPPGTWIIGRSWSQEHWAGGAFPHKSWLAAAGDRPVVCHRMDLHAAVVNEAVLAQCDTTADPPGGRIDRDPATGEPTGLMFEAAAWQLVNPLVPRLDAAGTREALRDAQQHLHALGLTAVGTMEYTRSVEDVFLPMREALSLRCRLMLLDRTLPMDFDFGRGFVNDDRLAVIGYKAFVDGSFGSRTARMLADYADEPGSRGMFVERAAEGRLNEWARAVSAAGFAPVIHAIGDEAVRVALDAIEALKPGPPRPPRPRLEHVQQIDDADFPRFSGVVASMQPLHKATDCPFAERRVGRARLAGTFAFRRLLDAGAVLAFGSDWPVVSADPLAGMRTAITGLTVDEAVFGADQNLTVAEALEAYTATAAGAVGLPDAGVLRPGGLGDVVLLDQDPFEANWAEVSPKVITTVVGGEVAYDAR